MICVNCKNEFNPEVITNDRGRYAWCPHCGGKYAVSKTAKRTSLYLIENEPEDDMYAEEERDDDWR